MLSTLLNGANYMRAHSQLADLASQNLANINTFGYHRLEATFNDFLFQGRGDELPHQAVMDPGALIETGNKFDLAVAGNGFFQVELPSGESVYTRLGHLQRDAAGRLVTAQGGRLLGLDVTLDEGQELQVATDGRVLIGGSDGMQAAGRLRLVNFNNPAALIPIGNQMYRTGSDSGVKTEGWPGENGIGQLQQGILEASNVSLVDELIRLTLAQRSYQLTSRAVQASSEMWSLANQLRR